MSGEPLLTRHHFIGRTLLKTYPPIDSVKEIKRFYTIGKYKANLCGHEFQIESIPFQAQDGILGACATVALWTVSQSLRQAFDSKVEPPSNITKSATTRFISGRQCYPSEGLTFEQMIGYIQSLDLDVDIINVSRWDEKNGTYVAIGGVRNGFTTAKLAIKAFHKIHVPLIAMLVMRANGSSNWLYHAAVVTGYRINKEGEIDEIYLHDDQIGPFCHTLFVKKKVRGRNRFRSVLVDRLENAWNDSMGVEELVLVKLIIPRYPKIRLMFAEIAPLYKYIDTLCKNKELDSEVLFYTVEDYKKEIINNNSVKNKSVLLKENLPKYILVLRILNGNIPLGDLIFDATHEYALEPYFSFDYNYGSISVKT